MNATTGAPRRFRLATPRIAVALTAFELAMVIAFAVIYLSPITPAAVSQSAGGVSTAVFVIGFSGLAAVGGLIAARRPDNPVGWAMSGGVGLLLVGALCSLISSLLVHSGNPAGQWVSLGSIMWAGGASPSSMLFVLALLLFPDGRLPARRWIWLVRAEALLVVITVASTVLDPAPGLLGIGFTSDASVNASSPVAVPGLAGLTIAGQNFCNIAQYAVQFGAVLSVFLRLRGADSERRHQIKWFASGAAITVAGIALTSSLPSPTNPAPGYVALFITIQVILLLALPVSFAVAMLRYHLYDIDVIISRALVYGVLAVFITAVYVGIAVGIGTFVGSGGKPNLGLSILATAIVAVGFQPLRQRLQRIANRLVYGKRATPYEVLSEFSQHVAATYAVDDVLPRMARVLREGTGAESATVWLRSGEELRPAATHPVESNGFAPVRIGDDALPVISGADGVVAVESQGELLGALTVVKRRGEALTPVEHKLIDDLARQAGLVLKNVALTAELLRRMEDLRESRQRLVQAQDQERRRLERNLHDGAQQHLVALKVKIGLVKMLMQRDAERARATLGELRTDADEALDALRDLARGIYPPLLAERGLAVALESQARKAALPVTVEADGIGRYPQDVEATVYFCVLEALQNVQKYANASRAVVRLAEGDGSLRFSVEDDGAGFDAATVTRGAGLTNMGDRLDALGGTLGVDATPGRGTMLTASLPLQRSAVA